MSGRSQIPKLTSQVLSGPSITQRQLVRGKRHSVVLSPAVSWRDAEDGITRPCRRWQSPPRDLWAWGGKWSTESSATHQWPRTCTSAAGVEYKLKHTLVGDQICLYWSLAEPKCLTAVWEYWLPTDCGVTLLNTPTLVSHNRGLINATDTSGRAVCECAWVRALLLFPTQIRRSVKDASAVTHLCRLQAGEGRSEVQPAAETRWVSRHRKRAGRRQAGAPPVCRHRPPKHQVRILPVGIQLLRLVIPASVRRFIVKYRAAQIKDELLDAFSLVWVLKSADIIWGGAANSSASRQGRKWGALVSFYWDVSWYVLLISSAFQGSFLITDPGMCKSSSWSQ